MKLNAISTFLAITMAGVAGTAGAVQPPPETLAPVNVSATSVASCVPPTDALGHACDSFDQLVRANFTEREIGMLFGYQTSYPESLTGGVERVQRRYRAMLREYTAARAATHAAAVAVK
ncbi:MAG TPA: hypothetical protein VF264_01325 [Rhodanobacteraceae bacterium]